MSGWSMSDDVILHAKSGPIVYLSAFARVGMSCGRNVGVSTRLAKAKYYALTGEWISGRQAAEADLINFSYPLEELDERVMALDR